jgi:hypothetical protein
MSIMAFAESLLAVLYLLEHMQNLVGGHDPMPGRMDELLYIGY